MRWPEPITGFQGLEDRQRLALVRGPRLLLMEIVSFKELRPEILWRSGNVRPTFRRIVHEVPIGPNRVDMVFAQFSSPEVKDLSVLFLEDMHHGQLHVVGILLAFVIRLVGRIRS